jgi:hypothetical protein
MQNLDDFREVLEVVSGEPLFVPPGTFCCHLGAGS